MDFKLENLVCEAGKKYLAFGTLKDIVFQLL